MKPSPSTALRRGAVVHHDKRRWIVWDIQRLIAAPIVGYTFRPIRTDFVIRHDEIPGFGHLTHGVRFGEAKTIGLSRSALPLTYASDEAIARMSQLLERVATSIAAENSRKMTW